MSLVESRTPWAFFTIAGADRGAPKWIFMDDLDSELFTYLDVVSLNLEKDSKKTLSVEI